MAEEFDTRSTSKSGGFPLRLFAGMAALVVVLRSALILSLADVFFYGEELEKGAAAKAMLDGLPVEHFRLAYHAYEGGGFAASHLKALSFLFVGENLMAHKVAALVMILCVLAAGLRLVNYHFGRRPAFLFGLLFALSPGSMQQLSLLHLGIHFEATLFAFLILDQGARLAFPQEDAHRSPRAFVCLGLITGLGIWFNYQIAPLAAYTALVLWLCRALDARRIAAGLAGTLLGLAPLLWMAAHVGGEVLNIHGVQLFGDGADETAWPPILETLAAFTSSLYFEGSLLQRVSALIMPGALVASLLLAARRWDNPRTGLPPGRRFLFVVGALGVLLLAYVASPFRVGAVYHPFLLMRFAPAWGLTAVLIAAACGRVLGPVPRRRISMAEATPWGAARFAGGLVLAACLCAGLGGGLSLMSAGKAPGPRAAWDLLRSAPGVSYGGYFPKFEGHLDGTPDERLAILLSFDERRRASLEAAAGRAILRRDGLTLDELLALAEGLGASPAVLLGSGAVQVTRAGGDMNAAVTAAQAHPRRVELLEALGRFGGRWRWTRVALVEDVPGELERYGARGEMEPWWRGLGHRVHAAFPLDPWSARDWLSRLPDHVRGPAAAGWEAARLSPG
jgi:hypothetical protein